MTFRLRAHDGRSRIVVAVTLVFALLFSMVGFQAAHELLGLAGGRYSNLIDSYLFDAVIAAAALLMILRALLPPREIAWLLLALGALTWVAADILLDLNQGLGLPEQLLWLAWYLLAGVALVLLVRSRIAGFDLARWLDGIALALIVATPLLALSIGPAIESGALNGSVIGALTHEEPGAFAFFDVLLLGASAGIIGLAGFRPGPGWYLLIMGIMAFAVVDALYAVQWSSNTYVAGAYDFIWPAGMLIVAYSAWQRHDVIRVQRPSGSRAVVLALTCQLAALAIQIWGFTADLGVAERVMGIAVLVVVSLQIWVGRPRYDSARLSAAPEAHASSNVDPVNYGDFVLTLRRQPELGSLDDMRPSEDN